MDNKDIDLLKRYRNGEVAALEQLVDKYKRPLFGYILNMTEGRDDADEIFQEVWFRVIKKFRSYNHRNFLGWLVRIAHNIIIDRARKRKPGFSMDEEKEDGRSAAETIPGKDPGPASEVEARDLGTKITSAVGSLPEDQKEVFLLRVQAGLPFKEIASIQKISINTALARMQYALSKLRPMLKQEYSELST